MHCSPRKTQAESQCSQEDVVDGGKIEHDASVSVDDVLNIVGEYGRYQLAVNVAFCAMVVPLISHIMIVYFCTVQPPWRCAPNSSICLSNETFESTNRTRCLMPRTEWDYTTPNDFSMVTQFDIGCYGDWLLSLPSSIFFFGWLIGASVMGWCADNFGRKKIIYISSFIIICSGILTPFMPTIYGVIGLRFIAGFFMQGSTTQMRVLLTEIVGNNHRVFVNTMFYLSADFGLSLLAVKAYYIKSWKILYIACTAPYVILLFSYPFVPESVRYLRVKGKIGEAMIIFQKIAKWNNTKLPPTLVLSPIQTTINHKSNPLHLFRSGKMAIKSSILGFTTFVMSFTFYNLYFGAANITGHMYRDYLILTVIDFPVTLSMNKILQKYGRKKPSMVVTLIASVTCIALGFTPKTGKIKSVRVVLAMIGKCCTGAGVMAVSIWSLELYATNIRSEGLGYLQVTNKIGATSAVWIEKELTKIYEGSSFILIGAMSVIVCVLLKFLPEMKGVMTQDVEDVKKESGQQNTLNIPGEVNRAAQILEMNVTSYTNRADDDDSKVENI